MVCTFNSIFYYQSATALPGTYDSLLKLKKKELCIKPPQPHPNICCIAVGIFMGCKERIKNRDLFTT